MHSSTRAFQRTAALKHNKDPTSHRSTWFWRNSWLLHELTTQKTGNTWSKELCRTNHTKIPLFWSNQLIEIRNKKLTTTRHRSARLLDSSLLVFLALKSGILILERLPTATHFSPAAMIVSVEQMFLRTLPYPVMLLDASQHQMIVEYFHFLLSKCPSTSFLLFPVWYVKFTCWAL